MCGITGIGGAGGVYPSPAVKPDVVQVTTATPIQQPQVPAVQTTAQRDAATGAAGGGSSSVIQGVGELNSALVPLLKQLADMLNQLMGMLTASSPGENPPSTAAGAASGRYRG